MPPDSKSPVPFRPLTPEQLRRLSLDELEELAAALRRCIAQLRSESSRRTPFGRRLCRGNS